MDINRLISLSLRVGVLAAVVLSIFGLLAWISSGSNVVGVVSGSDVWSTLLKAFQVNAAGLIYLSVAFLIATPIFRVGLSAVYFGHEKDGKYVLISLAVLSMLFIALLSGATG